MATRWRALIHRLDRYYDQDWRQVWFQPILFLFVFGAAVRLAVNPDPTPPFEQFFGTWFYWLCLTLGVVAPLLCLLAWILIRGCGRAIVLGQGIRLSGDIGVMTVLLSYHLTELPISDESHLFSRYVVAAVMVFVLEMIVRDLWAIRLVNKLARKRAAQ